MSHGQVRALLCFVRCGIKWQHSTLRSDETTNPHSRELHTSCYPPSQYCNMSPAGIMDATIPIAFSVSPTVPTPTPSPVTDVYHRGGIRGKVESLIYGTCRCGMNYAASHGTDWHSALTGVSDKLLPRHYKPFYRGTEAERRARSGSIVELQEMGPIHPAA